ncbi:hypothetical protein BDZ89DRAFT_1065456, partial [Hymenopellis radicata]
HRFIVSPHASSATTVRTAQAAHSTTEWHPSQGTGWWRYGAPFFASISALRFVCARSQSLQFRRHIGS